MTVSAPTEVALRLQVATGDGGPAETQRPNPPARPPGVLSFSCSQCSFEGTSACDDCVVSFVLDRDPEDAVVIDADEARAMRLLHQAGLVPSLKFEGRAG